MLWFNLHSEVDEVDMRQFLLLLPELFNTSCLYAVYTRHCYLQLICLHHQINIPLSLINDIYLFVVFQGFSLFCCTGFKLFNALFYNRTIYIYLCTFILLQIRVNGNEFHTFKHRMRLESVRGLHILGDVSIQTINVIGVRLLVPYVLSLAFWV